MRDWCEQGAGCESSAPSRTHGTVLARDAGLSGALRHLRCGSQRIGGCRACGRGCRGREVEVEGEGGASASRVGVAVERATTTTTRRRGEGAKGARADQLENLQGVCVCARTMEGGPGEGTTRTPTKARRSRSPLAALRPAHRPRARKLRAAPAARTPPHSPADIPPSTPLNATGRHSGKSSSTLRP